jgi:hypothetical protein
MAANYTFTEMADMHLCYGCAHGNAREARHLYKEQFPGCFPPDARMFTSIHQTSRERGTFVPPTHDQGRPKAMRNPDLENRILTHIANNPATSMRMTAAVEGIPQSNVWQVLQPYHLQ